MYEVFATLDTNPKREHMERMLLACLGILDMHNPISWEQYADGVRAIVDGLKIGRARLSESDRNHERLIVFAAQSTK